MLLQIWRCRYFQHSIFIFFANIPRSRNAGSIFNFLRGTYAVYHSGCTSTQSHLRSTAAAAAVASVVSDSVRPHRRQPTRLPHPWDSPGKNTGVGCHFLFQCMKVKRESEVAQSCPTPSDPMDCSPPGSSVHGIFQARVLEWGAIAFSDLRCTQVSFSLHTCQSLLSF